jgi:hypothetical protein
MTEKHIKEKRLIFWAKYKDEKGKISFKIYKKIGGDVFFVISTAVIAPLWINNGFSFFNDFDFVTAFMLNVFCSVSVVWGFKIYREMQVIEKIIFYSLDNPTRKNIEEAEKGVEKIANGIFLCREPYKSICCSVLQWSVWSLIIIITLVLKINAR